MAESEPDLLEIGNSQEETQRLLEEHEQLLIKLKVLGHSSGPWTGSSTHTTLVVSDLNMLSAPDVGL